jgi:hypothetical protein
MTFPPTGKLRLRASADARTEKSVGRRKGALYQGPSSHEGRSRWERSWREDFRVRLDLPRLAGLPECLEKAIVGVPQSCQSRKGWPHGRTEPASTGEGRAPDPSNVAATRSLRGQARKRRDGHGSRAGVSSLRSFPGRRARPENERRALLAGLHPRGADHRLAALLRAVQGAGFRAGPRLPPRRPLLDPSTIIERHRRDRSRSCGQRVGWMFVFAAAAYNLVRMRNLSEAT